MLKPGLKLFSVNSACATDAVRLYECGLCSYIELYAVPDSFDSFISVWKNTPVPFVIHAAHYGGGMNLAVPGNWPNNRVLAEEAFRYADVLAADKVIFHTGVNGTKEETARQIALLGDVRIIIENKPYKGSKGDIICVGSTSDEIEFIMKETDSLFCLDFGHAVSAANSFGTDSVEFVKSFLRLKPAMYHICDGDFNSEYDTHDSFGKGSYPIKEFLSMLPEAAMITDECSRKKYDSLSEAEINLSVLINTAEN